MDLFLNVFWFDKEMAIMEWFYQIGSNFLNIVFYLISQLGGSIIIIGVIGVVYWCIDKEKGERIGFTIITSICINGVFKSLFSMKRPFEYEGHEHLHKLQDSKLSASATGSSFPSGHSQNAGCLYSNLAINFKKKWLTWICVIIAILIPVSRLYLGVHFPSDVMVGLILGIAISVSLYFILTRFKKQKFWIYLGTLLVFTPLVLLNSAEHDFVRGYGLLAGFILGIFIENKFINFDNNVTLLKKLIRLLIGIFLVGGAFVIIKVLPEPIEKNKWVTILSYFIIGFLALGVVPFCFQSKRNPKGL